VGTFNSVWTFKKPAIIQHANRQFIARLTLRLREESGNPRDFELILRHKSQGLLEVENPIVASQGPRAGGAHSTGKAQRVFE
jgi:hypothetical protein